jgi:MoaA/NifB/PqqE/SkfB family radical SAM enzyme
MGTFAQKWKRRIRHYTNDFAQRIHPTWLDHPLNIQIDTHNYCNLWMKRGKGCEYCNVKPGAGWKISRGWMPTKMVEYIIGYWAAHGAESIAPYINGEPMMDKRLLHFCDVAQENGLFVVVDTNGTLYENRNLLVHPAIREVRFSISANTPETYRKVHGQPVYERAISTLEWFLDNRMPSQQPILHFIASATNIHEVDDYIERWRGIHMRIFPLHRVPTIQLQSDKMAKVDYWWDNAKQPNRPLVVHPNGKTGIEYLRPYETCQGKAETRRLGANLVRFAARVAEAEAARPVFPVQGPPLTTEQLADIILRLRSKGIDLDEELKKIGM